VTKIAVITDTHANLPALEAALGAISGMGCEAIFHTGDAVGIGPFPQEVLDRLLHTPGMHLLMGNHDELCAWETPEPRPPWIHDELAANARWTRTQVDPQLCPAIATWPYEIVATIAGHRLAFLHYPLAPGGDGFAPIIEAPSAEDLDVLFAGVPAEFVFYGHHHPAADDAGRSRYINPGSLGCGAAALARFTVVHLERASDMAVQHHAVSYDRGALHKALISRDMPDHEFLCQAFFP
jgi:predicted phosphodiesterase